MMRILHLNAQADCGGAETMILGFLERSRERGDVTAVAMADGAWRGVFERAADMWCDLPLVQQSPARLPGLVAAIRRIVRRFRPDVIHAHNPTMMMGAMAATAGLRGIRLIGTLHGGERDDYRREAVITRLFPGVVVSCAPFITEALAHYGADATTITNGVPELPAAVPQAEFRRRFGVPQDRPIVVGVGRLHPRKRWHLAIDAMREVPDAVLVIFGEGPARDELEQRVRDRGLEGRVLLPGVVDDVRGLVGAADVAVMTTAGEGFSLAVLELLSAGVPLVAADVPGIAETVDDDSAIMIDPEDAAATAAAIRACCAGGAGVRERVARGREIAAEHSLDRMNDRYFALYDRPGRGLPAPTPGIFHDWRWNDVITMRAIDVAEGSRIPGFGDDAAAVRRERARSTRMLLSRIPISAVDFVELGDCPERDCVYLRMHRHLAEHGGLTPDRMLVADCGRYVGIAVPHTLGDFPTYSAALGPFTAPISGAPVPSPTLPFDDRPVLSLLRAAARSLVARPVASIRAVREVLADERAGKQPAQAPRSAAARPRYHAGSFLWTGEGRRPRATALARAWRAALEEELGPGVLDPRDAWVIVGLRTGSPILGPRGGNFLARVRMPLTDDHDADVAATIARIRSPYPLMRTTLSAVPQQIRQLLGRGAKHPVPAGISVEQEAPVGGLTTAWAYSRLDVPEAWEASSALVGPGVIAANAYEGLEDMSFVMSGFVDDDTWRRAVDATARVLADAGWESRRRRGDESRLRPAHSPAHRRPSADEANPGDPDSPACARGA